MPETTTNVDVDPQLIIEAQQKVIHDLSMDVIIRDAAIKGLLMERNALEVVPDGVAEDQAS